MTRAIPPGAKVLAPKRAAEKFDRGLSWIWDQVKNNPLFVKPIYLAPHSPVFLENELDAYLALMASLPRNPVNVGERSKHKAARQQAATGNTAQKAS